ncbi:endonuclease/exonuclease/phosphatase family protein [Halorarius halobius]|uniref:endonuclease/exonuclease/phosphatase family protein n=1 Tax=Halorarius halobius TaxID=2962671 RepID=UPI0020CE681F|nr:endonuclease/exonuclease/phosphatase family protein [Halorarius halobius]
MAVTLLSFNVRYSGLDTGDRAWERRRDAVASVVARATPDVLCLQEVWRGQLTDLRERLPDYAWVGRSVAGGEHTPVGYDADRFALDDWGAFGLSETPEAPERPGWDAALPRVTTWARLWDGDRSLTAVSTHFDHEGERARRESADLLADWVTDREEPVALAGDLNCEPHDPPHARLVDEGPLADAGRTDGAASSVPTFTDFGGPDGGRRLDYVLLTDELRVERFDVLDARPDGGYPSDHDPVVVDLAWR